MDITTPNSPASAKKLQKRTPGWTTGLPFCRALGHNDDEMTLTEFGRYRLLERIGVGGMAEVFVARSLGAGDFIRNVVVKRMLPQLAQEPESVAMFLDEARLGAKLHHAHIVSVLDLGETAGDYFMVLEHVDGVDLGTVEARARKARLSIPMEHAAYVVARAAEGLDAAHAARDPDTGEALRIVHRDVSPSNILVGKGGDVKVADFGVARSTAQHVRTNTGSLKGKVPYMSPEQLLGEAVDLRSDIYALGVVFWQLLTQRRRHEGRNEVQIIQAVVREDPPPAHEVNPGVDRALSQLTKRMLARDPVGRPATAWDVSAALDNWLHDRRYGGRRDLERWLGANPVLIQPVTFPDAKARLATPASALPAQARRTPQSSLSSSSPERHVAHVRPVAPVVLPPSFAPPVRPGEVPWQEPPATEADLTAPIHADTLPQEPPSLSGPTLRIVPPRGAWDRLADSVPTRNPSTTTRLVAQEAVVVAPSGRVAHTFNATATFIWARVDGAHTVRQIAEEVVRFFDVKPDVAREEVVAFVEDAAAMGLLSMDHPG